MFLLYFFILTRVRTEYRTPRTFWQKPTQIGDVQLENSITKLSTPEKARFYLYSKNVML